MPDNLPPPDCHLGYTKSQINEILGERSEEFNEWMANQTVALCNGVLFDYDTREYEPDPMCTQPHGIVFYTHDVDRFISWKRHIPVAWD